MIIAEKDGLSDDAISASRKMKNCKTLFFKGMPHGFLGLQSRGIK